MRKSHQTNFKEAGFNPLVMITSKMRSAIGTNSKASTHRVELGAIRRFAEAIGDTNFVYYDNRLTQRSITECVVATPTFSRSLRPSPAKLEFDVPYTGVLDGGSEWQYFLPIRPGENITVTTKLVDLQVKSGKLGDMLLATRETVFVNEHGTTAICERDVEIYYDDQSPLAKSTPDQSETQHASALSYESTVAENISPRFDNIKVGMQLPVLTKQPTIRQLVMYAGASGDFYEIHYDLDFAKARGLNEVIVHGALKSAFLGQLLTDWIGEEGELVRLAVQYRGMDKRDNALYCTGTVTGKHTSGNRYLVDLDLWIENEFGNRTTHGSATLALT